VVRRQWVRLGAATLGLAMLVAAAAACTARPADTAAGPVAAVSSAPSSYAGSALVTPRPRPAFTLTDTDGAAFDFAARTAGRPTLLFFGYTNCPDVCPTTMADIGLALRQVPEEVAERARVVFVTTDPARDTPQVLTEWLSHFDRELPHRFIGLTGTVAEVEAAQRAAEVMPAEENGTMHESTVHLYGPDDLARVIFTSGAKPEEMAQDLQLVAGQ
jgi:protein SCO1/2